MKDLVLAAQEFSVAYGEVPVVRAVSLTLAPGEIVAVLGRNGMGKTTLLRGIAGLAPVRSGRLAIAGMNMIDAAPETIARAGVGYVPAGRGIFGRLSVRENLVMCARAPARVAVAEPTRTHAAAPGYADALRRAAHHMTGVVGQWLAMSPKSPVVTQRRCERVCATTSNADWTLERVLALFPRLAERMHHGGQNLSGGEQQMLAIGRALLTNPQLLLIDEATEGLAPLIARDIWRTLSEICRSGVTAIIVDRDVRRLAKIASRAVVLFKGEVVFDGPPERLLADADLVQRFIGL